MNCVHQDAWKLISPRLRVPASPRLFSSQGVISIIIQDRLEESCCKIQLSCTDSNQSIKLFEPKAFLLRIHSSEFLITKFQ